MSNTANSIWRSMPQAALEVLRGQHLVEEFARQRLRPCPRAAVMSRSTSHSQQKFSMNWLRQLDRVPLHAVDAGHAEVVDARQQVVQAVAELMEQRETSSCVKSAGLPPTGAREVAGQVRDRDLQPSRLRRGVIGVVHPRAAALAFARVQVEVELRRPARRPCSRTLEEAHVRMPQRRLGRRRIVHAVERLGDAEQARQHGVLAGNTASLPDRRTNSAAARSFSDGVGEVPRLRVLGMPSSVAANARNSVQSFSANGRARFARSSRNASTCAGDSAIFGTSDTSAKFSIAEQLRHLRAQRTMLAMSGVLSHSGLPNSERARRTLASHTRDTSLAQLAVVGVLHDREIRRHVQRELPALLAFFLRGFARRLRLRLPATPQVRFPW